jgi:hypothetical protein
MNANLAVGLVVVTSLVCGVALWPGSRDAAAPTPVVRELAAPELEVAHAALAAMPDALRARAVLAPAVERGVLLTRAVPPAALGAEAGVAIDELPELPRALLHDLLAHAAATLAPGAPPPANVHFACAGSLRAGGAFYVRLHGDGFAVEWVARGDRVVHAAWHDFARGEAPWLVEQVFAR